MGAQWMLVAGSFYCQECHAEEWLFENKVAHLLFGTETLETVSLCKKLGELFATVGERPWNYGRYVKTIREDLTFAKFPSNASQ